MSHEITIASRSGSTRTHHLATNSGLAGLGGWVEGLDRATYPDLHDLLGRGATEAPRHARAQLRHALDHRPMACPMVAQTALHLHDILGGCSRGDAAVIGCRGDWPSVGADSGSSGITPDQGTP